MAKEEWHQALSLAGGLYCLLSDWALYGSLHLRGALGEPGLLLKPASFQALHRDWYNQDYALGWFVVQRNWANGRVLRHNGLLPGWTAYILYSSTAQCHLTLCRQL